MTTDIIKGVVARIYEILGRNAGKIYTGEVPQGYSPPCFLLKF